MTENESELMSAWLDWKQVEMSLSEEQKELWERLRKSGRQWLRGHKEVEGAEAWRELKEDLVRAPELIKSVRGNAWEALEAMGALSSKLGVHGEESFKAMRVIQAALAQSGESPREEAFVGRLLDDFCDWTPRGDTWWAMPEVKLRALANAIGWAGMKSPTQDRWLGKVRARVEKAMLAEQAAGAVEPEGVRKPRL